MNDKPSACADLGLQDRVVVVTGAGSGIGRAIAVGFAKAGARVAVLGRRLENLAETVAEIERGGGHAVAVACDVSQPASVAQAAQRCEATWGPCDVLVNNAGVILPGPLESLSLAHWNEALGTNLTGGFLCAQTFARQMRPRGRGALVHLASVGAHHPCARSGAYSVAKAGVAMLSRLLAVEWGKDGIRSNVVNPGPTLTPMTQGRYQQPGVMEGIVQGIPIGRVGQPEDTAAAVLFLASDRAAYITGQEITIDGGFTNTVMASTSARNR